MIEIYLFLRLNLIFGTAKLQKKLIRWLYPAGIVVFAAFYGFGYDKDEQMRDNNMVPRICLISCLMCCVG